MSSRSILLGAVLAGLCVAQVAPLRAAPEDRKSLVVRGRASDRDGWPIEGARISLRGSRSASASTDASGRFTLGVSLGALRDLLRGPVDLTLEVRGKEGRLALGDGSGELRLVIVLAGEPGGEARAQVHSSVAAAAAAVAHALGQPGEATAFLEVAFVAAASEGRGPERAEITAHEEVSLPGVTVGAAAARAIESPSHDSLAAAARTRAAQEKQAREQEKRDREARERQAREQAAREREARARALREQAARERASRAAAAKEITANAPPPQAPPSGPAAAARDTGATAKPAPASEPVAKSSGAEGRVTSPPAGSGARGSRSPAKPGARTPPASRPSASAATPGASAPPPSPAATPRASVAPGRSTASAPPPEPCGCIIEGTIEVQSDRPLSRRLPLVVRLRDQPACRDTVELFMGSPRVFELRGATCGTHLIVVEIPARERFRLATPESERTVGCTRRGARQSRLILLPR